MALVRWDPFGGTMQNELSRLFNLLDAGTVGERGRFVPAVEMRETDDSIVMEMDLPGMTEDDIDIEVQDNVLTITGERRQQQEQREEGLYRSERMYGRFMRSLAMPESVTPENVQASFDKGVLRLEIPKPEERKPQKISIGGSQRTIEGSTSGQERREQR